MRHLLPQAVRPSITVSEGPAAAEEVVEEGAAEVGAASDEVGADSAEVGAASDEVAEGLAEHFLSESASAAVRSEAGHLVMHGVTAERKASVQTHARSS